MIQYDLTVRLGAAHKEWLKALVNYRSTLQWLILEGQRHTDTQTCSYTNFVLNIADENSSGNWTVVSFTSKATSYIPISSESVLEGVHTVAAELVSNYSTSLYPFNIRFFTQDAKGRIHCFVVGSVADSNLTIFEQLPSLLRRNTGTFEGPHSATLEVEVPASTLDEFLLVDEVLSYLRLLRLVATVRCDVRGRHWRQTFDLSSRTRMLFFQSHSRQIAASPHCYSSFSSVKSSGRSMSVLIHPTTINANATNIPNFQLLFDVALGIVRPSHEVSFIPPNAAYKRLCLQVFGPGAIPIVPVTVSVAGLVEWSNYGLRVADDLETCSTTSHLVASSVHKLHFVTDSHSETVGEENAACYNDLHLFIFIDSVYDCDAINNYDLLSWLRSEDNLKGLFENAQVHFRSAFTTLFDRVFFSCLNRNMEVQPQTKRRQAKSASDGKFIPTIARSLTRILRNSTNSTFRTACLELSQTKSLEEFQDIVGCKLRSITTQDHQSIEIDQVLSDESRDQKLLNCDTTQPPHHSASFEAQKSMISIPEFAGTTDWSDFDNWGNSFDVDRQELVAADTAMIPVSIQKTNDTNCKRNETSTSSQDSALSEQPEWSDDDGSSTTAANYTDCEDESWIWEDELPRVKEDKNTQSLIQPSEQVERTDRVETSYTNKILSYPTNYCFSDVTEDKVQQPEAFWEL